MPESDLVSVQNVFHWWVSIVAKNSMTSFGTLFAPWMTMSRDQKPFSFVPGQSVSLLGWCRVGCGGATLIFCLNLPRFFQLDPCKLEGLSVEVTGSFKPFRSSTTGDDPKRFLHSNRQDCQWLQTRQASACWGLLLWWSLNIVVVPGSLFTTLILTVIWNDQNLSCSFATLWVGVGWFEWSIPLSWKKNKPCDWGNWKSTFEVEHQPRAHKEQLQAHTFAICWRRSIVGKHRICVVRSAITQKLINSSWGTRCLWGPHLLQNLAASAWDWVSAPAPSPPPRRCSVAGAGDQASELACCWSRASARPETGQRGSQSAQRCTRSEDIHCTRKVRYLKVVKRTCVVLHLEDGFSLNMSPSKSNTSSEAAENIWFSGVPGNLLNWM